MDRFQSLAAFVAVADRRSFAAAARFLEMSPPAVTRAVAAIERHLGVTLFHRSTRAVSLTDEGAAFLGRARGVLADYRAGRNALLPAHGTGFPPHPVRARRPRVARGGGIACVLCADGGQCR